MTQRLQRLNLIFMLAFGLVALGLLYWGVLRAPALLARDDNPRLVEAELRVQRGRILDRYGVELAKTVGELGDLHRRYRVPSSPAVGYYSMRYGVSGIELGYDDVLRGQVDGFWAVQWDQVLHRHPAGWDVQTTLDADLQTRADHLLAGWSGAIVVLEARSGDLLAMASRPSYDPNFLDEQFEDLEVDETAPLLNRATQGLYQPGTALQPFLLAAGLQQDLLSTNSIMRDLDTPVAAGEVWLDCVRRPPGRDAPLADALSRACPAPFVPLLSQLGSEGLQAALANFGLFDLPDLPLELALGEQPDVDDQASLLAEGMGQGTLTLNPVQMAWALAAIANEGVRPPLRLVLRTGIEQDSWDLVLPAEPDWEMSLDSATAAELTRVMVESAADWFNTDDQESELVIASHVGLAAAGPQSYTSWFFGFAPADEPEPLPRYVVVVLLEDTTDVQAAAEIGHALLISH